jgi:pyridoxine/pyridoxamine 5'-phosphate oxidase
MTSEVMNVTVEGKPATRIVVVSGETPIGGYQGGLVYTYYGIQLDGPRFVRNVFLWMSGAWEELKEVVKLMNQIDQLSSELNQLNTQIQACQPSSQPI